MPAAVIHSRGQAARDKTPPGEQPEPVIGGFESPRPFELPNEHTPLVTAFSPVTIERLDNEQEMESGADQRSGVHDSSRSGGDYSREQGVGRSPHFQWPWNIHTGAFNFQALDRWTLERSGLGLLPPRSGVNPYVGVQEPAYSPVTAMDQYTMYYEQDPDQHIEWPAPVTIPDAGSTSFTERAVLR
jgi:hypothetical protein